MGGVGGVRSSVARIFSESVVMRGSRQSACSGLKGQCHPLLVSL